MKIKSPKLRAKRKAEAKAKTKKAKRAQELAKIPTFGRNQDGWAAQPPASLSRLAENRCKASK
jgi:hypothetical protein